MSQNCETFATALLAQTRGSAELAIVLNHDSGNSKEEEAIQYGVRSDSTGQTMQLSRLRLAIKYKQKQVNTKTPMDTNIASLNTFSPRNQNNIHFLAKIAIGIEDRFNSHLCGHK